MSDRVAIQAAIDAAAASPDGGSVTLGAGRWTIDRAPLGSYDRFAGLSVGAKPSIGGAPATLGHNVTIRGVGPDTILELAGDHGGATAILIDILPGAEHIRIEKMTLRCRVDSSTPCFNTEEQTHAIATSGTCAGAQCLPIRDVQLSEVNFDWPRDDPAKRKGDCLRLLGNAPPTPATATAPAKPGTQLLGAIVTGCNFADCARSAITIQRGVFDLVLAANTFNATKTCVDGEATGGPLDIDARLTITGNVFRPGCSTSLSLTSTQGAAISGNTFAGNVTLYRSTGVSITGNLFSHTAIDTTGTIDVENVCDGLAVTGNTISRGGVAGAAVKIVPHSGAPCTHFAVTGNNITLAGASFGIYSESPSAAAITGNQITYATTAPSVAGIYVRSTLAALPVTGLAITSNTVAGGSTYAVQLAASTNSTPNAGFGSGILVANNVAVGPTFGLVISNSTGAGGALTFTSGVTSSGNAMPAGSYGATVMTHGD